MKTKVKAVNASRISTTLGKIEYLHNGKVVDVSEYKDEEEFIQDIQDEIRFQVPIRVTLYRDRHHKTNASFALRKMEGEHNVEVNDVVIVEL